MLVMVLTNNIISRNIPSILLKCKNDCLKLLSHICYFVTIIILIIIIISLPIKENFQNKNYKSKKQIWDKKTNFNRNDWKQSNLPESIHRELTYNSDFYSPSFEITEKMFQQILANLQQSEKKKIQQQKIVTNESTWNEIAGPTIVNGDPVMQKLPPNTINTVIDIVIKRVNKQAILDRKIYMSDTLPELCSQNNCDMFFTN
jgi:hypothetical protein